MKKIDLTGRTFGKLTVIECTGKHNSDKRLLWKCLCECGDEAEISGKYLKSGHTKSCGCIKKNTIQSNHHQWKGCGEISGKFFSDIKFHAIGRDLEFDIDIEYIWNLFLEQNRKCKYTGLELIFPQRSGIGNDGTASLDRIDSSKGYVKDNVQWVHKWINLMKLDWSEEEFIQWCRLVVNHADAQHQCINKIDS